jgi:hypothetical protein
MNCARTDRVAAEALFGEVCRNRFGQPDDGRFAGTKRKSIEKTLKLEARMVS